jgi:hypothetical protein
MAKATIKSSTGAVIIVEGSDSEVSSILTTFERSAAVGKAKGAVAKQEESKKTSPSYSPKIARSRGPGRDFARAAWPVDRVKR